MPKITIGTTKFGESLDQGAGRRLKNPIGCPLRLLDRRLSIPSLTVQQLYASMSQSR